MVYMMPMNPQHPAEEVEDLRQRAIQACEEEGLEDTVKVLQNLRNHAKDDAASEAICMVRAETEAGKAVWAYYYALEELMEADDD